MCKAILLTDKCLGVTRPRIKSAFRSRCEHIRHDRMHPWYTLPLPHSLSLSLHLPLPFTPISLRSPYPHTLQPPYTHPPPALIPPVDLSLFLVVWFVDSVCDSFFSLFYLFLDAGACVVCLCVFGIYVVCVCVCVCLRTCILCMFECVMCHVRVCVNLWWSFFITLLYTCVWVRQSLPNVA